jgi:hypothetical protein
MFSFFFIAVRILEYIEAGFIRSLGPRVWPLDMDNVAGRTDIDAEVRDLWLLEDCIGS